MFRKTDTTTRVRPNFRCWEVCVRALIAGAALSAMTAVNGALGHVVALAWDSCSASCASDIEDGSAIAWEAADDQATLSLIGRIPPQAASLFDRETVPEVLAAGLPSALFPNKMASAQDSSGFDYFFSHPDEIGAPGLFLSANSLTGQFTLGEFLSESHDYFSETLSLGQTQNSNGHERHYCSQSAERGQLFDGTRRSQPKESDATDVPLDGSVAPRFAVTKAALADDLDLGPPSQLQAIFLNKYSDNSLQAGFVAGTL